MTDEKVVGGSPTSQPRVSAERLRERIESGLSSLPPGRRSNPPEEIAAWLDLRDARRERDEAIRSRDAFKAERDEQQQKSERLYLVLKETAEALFDRCGGVVPAAWHERTILDRCAAILGWFQGDKTP